VRPRLNKGARANLASSKDFSAVHTFHPARSAPGGRVWTVPFSTVPGAFIDKGAGWLHGPTPANPLVSLAKKYNLQHVPAGNEQIFYQKGAQLTDAQAEEAQKLLAGFEDYIAEVRAGAGADYSLGQALDEFASQQGISGTTKDMLTELVSTTWEHEYSASKADLSVRYFDQDTAFSADDDLWPKVRKRGWLVQCAQQAGRGCITAAAVVLRPARDLQAMPQEAKRRCCHSRVLPLPRTAGLWPGARSAGQGAGHQAQRAGGQHRLQRRPDNGGWGQGAAAHSAASAAGPVCAAVRDCDTLS
jgi:hypothetical protein